MATPSRWGSTPRQSIEQEVARRGSDAVVAGCRALVRGEETDPDLVLALGGPAARKFLDGRTHVDAYWLKVWGLRGLLWRWAPEAMPELQAALSDPAWRVREMALKVATRHEVEAVVEAAAQLQDDPADRVRRQAHRYLMGVRGEPA
jgi:HEAT repeats